MNAKRITLAIAILSTLATAASAAEGWLSPAWAALVAALGAGCYAVVRALQKRAAGEEWKSMLSTTEAWGAALAIVAPIVLAAAKVMPADHAVGVAAIAGVLLKLARALQAPLPGGPKSDIGSLPGSQGGFAQVVTLIVLVAACLLLSAAAARAAESQFGGCFADGQLCAGPSATITVGEFNLASQKFSGGVTPGIGYGVTYMPDAWYATGLAGYLSFAVGGGQPNSARPALMLSFANYVRLGLGLAITERDVGTLKHWSLLFGLGSDFGGSPTYAGRGS